MLSGLWGGSSQNLLRSCMWVTPGMGNVGSGQPFLSVVGKRGIEHVVVWMLMQFSGLWVASPPSVLVKIVSGWGPVTVVLVGMGTNLFCPAGLLTS